MNDVVRAFALWVGFAGVVSGGVVLAQGGCASCGCSGVGGNHVHAPGPHPDPALVALIAEGQDGRGCPNPSETSPLGSGPSGNLSLIGARPFDLGRALQGGFKLPTIAHDPGRGLVDGIVAQTPLYDRHGFGAAFAVGRGGTVAPVTGAFVQRFTFLELPASATHMGLELYATYQSNAPTTGMLYQPFGPGFSLSGLDFLDGGSGSAPHTSVTLNRGDGLSYSYTRVGSGNTYTSPVGALDTLAWDGTSKYVRTLSDGRRITYRAVVGSTTLLVRETVTSLYGATITYVFDDSRTPLPELTSITDTRGVKVVLTWEAQSGGARRITKIAYDPTSIAWSSLYPAVDASSGENEIQLTYDGSARLEDIKYFPVWMVRDGNADQHIDLSTEQVKQRPILRIEYASSSGKMERLRDATYSSAIETRLKMVYTQSGSDWRVTEQIEGDSSSTDPYHTFTYTSSTQTDYVDPRGTTVTMTMDSYGRVTQVVMAASASATPTGKPRTADGFSDHSSLTWTISYTCQCNLPASITTPETLVYGYTWSSSHGGLTALSITPIGGGTARSHTFAYSTGTVNGVSAAWLQTYTDPLNKAWVYSYTQSGGTGVVTRIDFTSPSWTDADGGTHSSGVLRTTYFGSSGEITSFTDGVVTTGLTYAGSGSGHALLSQVTLDPGTSGHLAITTQYTADDLGRIHYVEKTPTSGRKMAYTSDLYYRTNQTTTPALGGSVTVASEAYFDRRGNQTVARHENRNENGSARTRQWIVTETFYDRLDQLVRRDEDHAALDASSASHLVTTYTYTKDHHVHEETLPDASVTRHVVDGYGMLYKGVLDYGGIGFVPERKFFDKDGHLTKIKDGLGRDTLHNSSAFGELDNIRDAENGKRKLYRDSLGRITKDEGIEVGTSETVRERTELDIDELGRTRKVTRYKLDSSGSNVSSEVENRFFDDAGRLIEVKLPQDRGMTAHYDDTGRISWTKDCLSSSSSSNRNQLDYVYETGSDRLQKIVSSEIEAGNFAIPPGGTITTRVYEEEYAYDLLDRRTSVTSKRESGSSTSPTQVVHTYKYDSFDYEVTYQDQNGAKVTQMRDPLGRERARTEVGTSSGTIGTTADYTMTSSATKVERRDARNLLTVYVYDKARRLAQIRHPGASTSGSSNPEVHVKYLSYDAAGNVQTVTTGNGTVVTQSFDSDNRLTQRLVTTLSGLSMPVSTLATKEAFTYDALGRLLTAETFYGLPTPTTLVRVARPRDSVSRPTSETFAWFGATSGTLYRIVTSDYAIPGSSDEDFRYRRKLTYPSGFEIGLTPDRTGKLQVVEMKAPDMGSAQTLAEYRYVGTRPVERRLHWSSGTNDWHGTAYGWDGHKRLAQLKTSSSSSTELSRWDMEFGDEGHLLKEKYYESGTFNQAGSKYYQNDQYYALDGAKVGVPSADFSGSFASAGYQKYHNYDLDSAHSRTQYAVTVNGGGTTTTTYSTETDSHRYASVDSVTMLYDGEGNTLFDGSFYYVYDFRNRLSEVYQYVPGSGESSIGGTKGLYAGKARYSVSKTKLETLRALAVAKFIAPHSFQAGYKSVKGSSAYASDPEVTEGTLELVAAYGYDPFNRRVVRSLAGAAALHSVYDGWSEIEELTSDETGPMQRAYVWGAEVDEMLCYAKPGSGSSWTKRYAHQDRVLSLARLVDGSGATIESYLYDPYGNPLSDSAVGNPYLWIGRREDSESGLYYFRNRYYAPGWGRFMTEDSLGLWSDELHPGHPYCYTGNSPTNFLDHSGLQSRPAQTRPHIGPHNPVGPHSNNPGAPTIEVPIGTPRYTVTLVGGPFESKPNSGPPGGRGETYFEPTSAPDPANPRKRMQTFHVWIFLDCSKATDWRDCFALFVHELVHLQKASCLLNCLDEGKRFSECMKICSPWDNEDLPTRVQKWVRELLEPVGPIPIPHSSGAGWAPPYK